MDPRFLPFPSFFFPPGEVMQVFRSFPYHPSICRGIADLPPRFWFSCLVPRHPAVLVLGTASPSWSVEASVGTCHWGLPSWHPLPPSIRLGTLWPLYVLNYFFFTSFPSTYLFLTRTQGPFGFSICSAWALGSLGAVSSLFVQTPVWVISNLWPREVPCCPDVVLDLEPL